METAKGFGGRDVKGSYYFVPCVEPLGVSIMFVGVHSWEGHGDGAWPLMRGWLKAHTRYGLKDDRMNGHLSPTTILFPDAAQKAAYVEAFDNGKRYAPRAENPYAVFPL